MSDNNIATVAGVLRSPRLLVKETLAGVITALALIPEVISFSVIAGVDPKVSLIASVVLCLVMSVLGGRPAMVTAAAGSVALVIGPMVHQHGVGYILPAVVLAGIIQILFGVCGLARMMRYIPRSVMTGFVNALGILIFVAQVLDCLAPSGADPRKLKLEITEGTLLDDVEDAIAKIKALKAYGMTFAIDDFGTGYSSLAYLKRLPLDMLKIDRSFVLDLTTNPNDAVIARTIIALGASLGLKVLAEGVETEAQRDFLFENGCQAYQGYLCARPLAAEELALMLHRH